MRKHDRNSRKTDSITIIVPCYNEVNNVRDMVEAIMFQMDKYKELEYDILLVDNASTDGSIDVITSLAKDNKKVKAIINNRNYGPTRSWRNAFRYNKSDAMLVIACDFQEPPERIPDFIAAWQEGYKIVCGQKIASKEGKLKYALRSAYYNIITTLSDVPQYKHISGIILYDRDIINYVLESDEDIETRHLIAELGFEVKLIPYEQQKRKSGKSSYSIWRYLSFAINSLIATSTTPLRIATITGFFTAMCSFGVGIIYLIYKLLYWDRFTVGTTPILLGMFFLGSIQILFIGLLGEYIGAILNKVTKVPPVIERETINIE